MHFKTLHIADISQNTHVQKRFEQKLQEIIKYVIIIIIINGATAQSRALASLTGFVTGILRCGLSAARSTCPSHPDSTTRDI
jgi:hypothetical protein